MADVYHPPFLGFLNFILKYLNTFNFFHKTLYNMKQLVRNLIAVFTLLLIFSLSGYAQIREILEAIKPKKEFAGTPILKKRSQIIQIGVGAPNNITSLINVGGILNSFTTSKSSSSIGPLMLDYEYLIKDNLGLGLDISYANASQTYNLPFGVGQQFVKLSGTSLLFSTTYHIYTTNKLDSYTKGSVGFTIWKGSYKNADGKDAGKLPLPTPVAYKALVGLRYFITQTVGAFGEASFSNLKFTAGVGVAVKIAN